MFLYLIQIPYNLYVLYNETLIKNLYYFPLILFSFISICANTPETFKNYKLVMILTYVTDLICTLVFTIEMIAKIKIKGLFRGESAYIFDRWCQFDGIMVIFHIISVVLQVKLLIISYLKLTNQ